MHNIINALCTMHYALLYYAQLGFSANSLSTQSNNKPFIYFRSSIFEASFSMTLKNPVEINQQHNRIIKISRFVWILIRPNLQNQPQLAMHQTRKSNSLKTTLFSITRCQPKKQSRPQPNCLNKSLTKATMSKLNAI